MVGWDRELPYVLDDVDRYLDDRWERRVELRRDERGAARLCSTTRILGVLDVVLVVIRELRKSPTGAALVLIQKRFSETTNSRYDIRLVDRNYLSMAVLLRLSLDWEEQCSNSSVLPASRTCCFLCVGGLGRRFRGEDATESSFLSGEVSNSKDPFNLGRRAGSHSEDGNLRIAQPDLESLGSWTICVVRFRRSS